MAKGTRKKKPRDPSAVVRVKHEKQEKMTQPDKSMFFLAATTLVIAVCVVPLTAEIPTCK